MVMYADRIPVAADLIIPLLFYISRTVTLPRNEKMVAAALCIATG